MIVSVCASHVIQIHDECWHPKILIIAIIKLVTSILVTNPLVYINNMMTLEGTIKCRKMYKSEMGKVKNFEPNGNKFGILSPTQNRNSFRIDHKYFLPTKNWCTGPKIFGKIDIGKKNFETCVR